MLLAFIYGLIFFQVSVVAWIDFKREIISNYWIILNGLCACVLPFILPALYPVSWEIRADIDKALHDLISAIKSVAKEEKL